MKREVGYKVALRYDTFLVDNELFTLEQLREGPKENADKEQRRHEGDSAIKPITKRKENSCRPRLHRLKQTKTRDNSLDRYFSPQPNENFGNRNEDKKTNNRKKGESSDKAENEQKLQLGPQS